MKAFEKFSRWLSFSFLIIKFVVSIVIAESDNQEEHLLLILNLKMNGWE